MQNNFKRIQEQLELIVGKTSQPGRIINEDQSFELKASALNKTMRYEMLKTITAFLNSHEVGVLFIGVSDDKIVLGLEETENKYSGSDNYEQSLISLIKDHLHDAANRISENLRFHFLLHQNKTVCAIEVRPFFPSANELIACCRYLDAQKNQTQHDWTFFKRTGTSTTKMTPYEVGLDMLNRRQGQLSNPTAPENDAGGKPYKLFDDVFVLLEVKPNMTAPSGKTRTELILQRDGTTFKKYRNEDWRNTDSFLEKAKSLVGRHVRLTSWKHTTEGDDYWWERGFISNVYAVNFSTGFNA